MCSGKLNWKLHRIHWTHMPFSKCIKPWLFFVRRVLSLFCWGIRENCDKTKSMRFYISFLNDSFIQRLACVFSMWTGFSSANIETKIATSVMVILMILLFFLQCWEFSMEIGMNACTHWILKLYVLFTVRSFVRIFINLSLSSLAMHWTNTKVKNVVTELYQQRWHHINAMDEN